MISTLGESVTTRFVPEAAIETFLKEGQEIIVQIAKEPISTKVPELLGILTFAGRHVVFMPYIEHTGVSRRRQRRR